MGVVFKRSKLVDLDIPLTLKSSNFEYRSRKALIAKLPKSASDKIKGYAPFYCRDLKFLSLPSRASLVISDSQSEAAGREINIRIVNVEKWINDYVYEYRANVESSDLVALRAELNYVENRGTVNKSEFDGHILIGIGLVNNSRLSRLLNSKLILSLAGLFFLTVVFSNLYFVSLISGDMDEGGLFIASEVFASVFILLVLAALFFSIVKRLPVRGLIALSLFAALFFIDRVVLAIGVFL